MCRITHVSYRAHTYTEIGISYTDRQRIAMNVEDKTCILPHTGGACGVMVAFHIALIPLGKVWIQLFSLQLWVNSRAD